jgi:hypothetical protein
MPLLCNSKLWIRVVALLALAIFAFVQPKIAFAANEVGNGGNVISCSNRMELLDLFEARSLRGREILKYPDVKNQPDNKPRQKELVEVIQLATERVSILSKFDPKTAQICSLFLKALETETDFLDSIELSTIDDSKHLAVPKGCQVKQLAIFRKDISVGEKRLLVNKLLWSRLSKVDKVGLVLHEALYRHLAGLGQTNSIHTRFLVGFLLDKTLSSESSTRYWQEIRRMKLPIYDPKR